MKPSRSLWSSTLPSLALLLASGNAMALAVSLDTVSIVKTGSTVGNGQVANAWDILINGDGTLSITLLDADRSEFFEWQLSGSASDSGQFAPSHPNTADGTGPLNTLLGSWANGSSGASYLFQARNTVSGLPADYHVQFSLSYINDGSLDPSDRLSVTVSSVPVPAAVWFFGSGLLGVLGLARRGKTA